MAPCAHAYRVGPGEAHRVDAGDAGAYRVDPGEAHRVYASSCVMVSCTNSKHSLRDIQKSPHSPLETCRTVDLRTYHNQRKAAVRVSV